MPQKLVTKSYSFYSTDLNEGKYDSLYTKAVIIRDFKNELSKAFCSDYKLYLTYDKMKFIKEFNRKISGLSGQDVQNAIADVYTAYMNKYQAFLDNHELFIKDKIKVTYYVKNTKDNKVGDVKEFKLISRQNDLTDALEYLSKYPSRLDYIIKNKDKHKLNKNIYNFVSKKENNFGERFVKLAKSINDTIQKRCFSKPIDFKSLSFSSCNQLKSHILIKNTNTKSIYNAYIVLGGQNTVNNKIVIPVKFSKKYHGKIKDYDKKPNCAGAKNFSYTICFEEGNKKKIRIILTKEVQENIIIAKKKYVGVDTNIKHNLFALSNNTTIDYDRKVLNDYVEFLKKLDKQHKLREEKGLVNKLSKKTKVVKSKWLARMRSMLERKCRELIDEIKDAGYNHLSIEDLSQFSSLFSRSEEFEGFKYSRLAHMLLLCDLKNILSSMCNKNNIQCTCVQAYYTSIACEKCGCIDSANRNSQEKFKCVCCGHEANADTHSAILILDRLKEDVFREYFLDNKKGILTPKKLKKELVKNKLAEFYTHRSRQENIVQNDSLSILICS